MRTFFFSLILLTTHCCRCQTINLSDSLRHVFSFKPQPTGGYNTWNSFITGRNVHLAGLQLGVGWRNTLTIGISYNWLATAFYIRNNDNPITQDARLKMRYIAPYVQYTFFKKGHWTGTVPLQLGFGKSFLMRDNVRFFEGPIMLYEASMQFEYRIFDLVGLGAGYGYRIMFRNNKEIKQQFTSPVYVLTARIIFSEIYRRYKNYKSKPSS